MKKIIGVFMLILSVLVISACSQQSQTQGEETENANNNSEQNTASGEEFPQEQIEMVVPYSPGGASDMVARTAARSMEEDLGVPVVSVNKTGGTGAVGMAYTEASNPDGYTVGYVPVEMTMLEALGLSHINPESFELLGRAIVIPAAITVPADAPYDTIGEFVDYAKEHPGEVRVGNSGTGSIWHIAAAGLAEETGIELTYVPFEGAAPGVTALMGGHIDAVSVSPAEVKSGVDSGDLKILAVMSSEKDPGFPEVPTLKEEGIDLEIAAWGGFAVPNETPEDIKQALEESVETAVNSEDFKAVAEERGLNVSYLSGEEFTEFAQNQYDMYQELIPTLELE